MGFADIKVYVSFGFVHRRLRRKLVAATHNSFADSYTGCKADEGSMMAMYRLPCHTGCEEVETLSTRDATEEPSTNEPTTAPTLNPAIGTPTAAPTICVPTVDVETISDFGPTFTPLEEVIRILQQTPDASTVTFQINQEWKLLEIGWIAAEY